MKVAPLSAARIRLDGVAGPMTIEADSREIATPVNPGVAAPDV